LLAELDGAFVGFTRGGVHPGDGSGSPQMSSGEERVPLASVVERLDRTVGRRVLRELPRKLVGSLRLAVGR
jgi:hypothetical protein